MKQVTLIIERCTRCPFYECVDIGPGGDYDYCDKLHKQIWPHDTIYKDCPLEDVE